MAAMLPVLVMAGALAAMPFGYGFRSENAAAPSGRVTVVGIWEAGGDRVCRAFTYGDLLPLGDALQVHFDLSPAEVDQCRAAFAAYDPDTGWLPELRTNERAYEGYRLEVDEPPPDLVVTIERFHGDAVSATTRYRVGTDGRPTDIETSSGSAGSGVVLVVGGLVGGALWLLWASWALVAMLRRRARAAAEGV